MRKEIQEKYGTNRFGSPLCDSARACPRSPIRRVSTGMFPRFMRDLRECAGMTQRELAAQIKRSQWWVARIETGSRRWISPNSSNSVRGAGLSRRKPCGSSVKHAVREFVNEKRNNVQSFLGMGIRSPVGGRYAQLFPVLRPHRPPRGISKPLAVPAKLDQVPIRFWSMGRGGRVVLDPDQFGDGNLVLPAYERGQLLGEIGDARTGVVGQLRAHDERPPITKGRDLQPADRRTGAESTVCQAINTAPRPPEQAAAGPSDLAVRWPLGRLGQALRADPFPW